MENRRILLDVTPEGIFYCEESKEQKEMRLNDIETDTFSKDGSYWSNWYKVNNLSEITNWLEKEV